MAWERKKIIVEPTGDSGSRRRKDIGGATVVEDGTKRYALFGSRGDTPLPSWLTYERLVGSYWNYWPQMEGFLGSEIVAPFQEPVLNPMWGIDGQYGTGTRFGTKANENWEWHGVYDNRPLLIEPDWPRASYCVGGASNPSVIHHAGGLQGTDDLLSDTKSIAVQAVFYFRETPKHNAALIARGDCWDIRYNANGVLAGLPVPGFDWRVRLSDGTVWTIGVPLGSLWGVVLNRTYLITGFFLDKGDDATLSVHVGRIDLSGDVERKLYTEEWSDEHTGAAPSLIDAKMEPVTLLNDWSGRNPMVTAAGDPAVSVGCVRVVTEIDAAYYDNLTVGFEGPFYDDCLGLPTLPAESLYGTVALRWALNEDTGETDVLDTGEHERYDARVTAGVEWTTVPEFSRLWLTADAPQNQDYILIASKAGQFASGSMEVISRMQQRLSSGTDPQIIIYNDDRSVSQTVNIDNIYRTANDGEYRMDFSAGSITNASGYPGSYPSGLDECSYAVLMDGAGAEETEDIIGVRLSANPSDGAMIYAPPLVPRFRYVMAYEGTVNWKENRDGNRVAVAGKAICLAVSEDPMEFGPGGLGNTTWQAAYRCQPLVLSISEDGNTHKDIGHPCLVKIRGLLYVLWSQETATGSGVYDIWGMLIGDPGDLWSRHYVVSAGHVAGNADGRRVLAVAQNSGHWDGQSLGSIDMAPIGQSMAACYSAITSGGEWEIGAPIRIVGPLAMDRATDPSVEDTTDAGGVSDPSAPFWHGEPVYILARSRSAASGGTGSLVLYENADGWIIREGDKLDDEDVIDEWDETETGDHGSANAIRGLLWWTAQNGTVYALVAGSYNVYWAETINSSPNGWELSTQIPQRKITTGYLYVRDGRAMVHMEPTPDAAFICLPGASTTTEVCRWDTNEIIHRAGLPEGGTPGLTAALSGGALEDDTYSIKLAWQRGDEYGSVGASVDVTLAAGTSSQAIDIHINDAFGGIWGSDTDVYVLHRATGLIAYVAIDGVYYKIQEFVLDVSDQYVTITSGLPSESADPASSDRAGPPRATFCKFLGERRIMLYNNVEYPDRIGWSRQGEPCVCPAANIKKFSPLGSVTAFSEAGDWIIVFGKRGLWAGYGSPDASGAGLKWREVSPHHGTPWFRSACPVGSNWTAFWHEGKVWFTDGAQVVDGGRPMGPLWDTVSASYSDRVVMQYHPHEDRLWCLIPSMCNIPNRAAYLDRPLHAMGSLRAEQSSQWSWWPASNLWGNVITLNPYGEPMMGDSRDGRVYQIEQGGDDDGEEIRAAMLTSTHYGRGSETVDDWRRFVGHVFGRGGMVDLTIVIDDGEQEWVKAMRVSPDLDAFSRMASSRGLAAVGAGIRTGSLQIAGTEELGGIKSQSLPILKGRSACVEVRFRGKDQGGKIRELYLEINNAGSRGGHERYSGKTQRGMTPVKWSRFVGTDLHTDSAELPDGILASSDNMDPRVRKAVVVRRGRRNLWADRRPLNSDKDGIPK